jgi:hypothetical protein
MVGLHRSVVRFGAITGDQFFGSADRHLRKLYCAMRNSSQPRCVAATFTTAVPDYVEGIGRTPESGLGSTAQTISAQQHGPFESEGLT